MARRKLTPEYAERLRIATAQSTLEYLKRAAAGIPANVIAFGLAAVLVEIITKHVNA
jgi:hypothetical protein